MACCKIPQNKSRLSAAVERRFYTLRSVTCSRLFGYSPRLAGLVYRSFGLWLILAAALPPVLAVALAFAASS